MTRIMRPNYDKPHRCPVWSGPAMNDSRDDSGCQGGVVRSILGADTYPAENWLASLLPGRCLGCGTWTIPMALCWLDRAITLGMWRERAVCAVRGHWWDSERPRGPLGYLPDRCWRYDRTRDLPGYDEAELIRRQRAATTEDEPIEAPDAPGLLASQEEA